MNPDASSPKAVESLYNVRRYKGRYIDRPTLTNLLVIHLPFSDLARLRLRHADDLVGIEEVEGVECLLDLMEKRVS